MLKAVARNIAKRFGYEVIGYPRAYAAKASLAGLLRYQDINLVLDVGANIGQFGADLRDAGYTGRIISFEPQSAAHEHLLQCAKADANWTVFERTAVGAETGTVEINLSGNSYSSSVLAMLPAHQQAAPESRYIGRESVALRRLDDLCELASHDRVLLKIDVQGYEKQVLDGAPGILSQCCAVLTEMSLVPLYEGQALAKEIWEFLAEKQFEPWALEPGFRDPRTARMLQFDGLFTRVAEHQRV